MNMDSEQMADTTGWDKVAWDVEKEVLLDSEGKYKISYYLAQWTNPDDATDIIYELHGNCWAWGVDVSTWTSGSSTLTCSLGFYYDETERVDWEQVSMVYGGNADDSVQTWSCVDGYSTSASEFTFTEDTTANCMANTSKS